MTNSRRVMAILAVVAALALGTVLPAAASSDDPRLVEIGARGKVVQLVADGRNTCALTENGQVYCWGANSPSPYENRGPFLLIALGTLLVAGGATLVLFSRTLSRSTT